MMQPTARIALLAVLFATACVTDEKGELADPGLAGKADFSDRVTMKGSLKLEETSRGLLAEAAGEFVEDFEFHGYELMVRGEAALRIEITHLGSSSSLDTALYVYGPRTGAGYAERLAFDDDAGWGKLSRLDSFIPPETGTYLVVVGSYSGLGRGDYRLEVECPGGDCLDGEFPAECPDRMAEAVAECVEEWLAEGNYEDSRHDAFMACTTDYYDSLYDSCCNHDPEPWCAAGEEEFSTEILPMCRDELGPLYPEDRAPLTLSRRDLDDKILDRLYGGSENECCSASGESYVVQLPTSGEITLEWVLDSVRQREDQPGVWQNRGEVAIGTFNDDAEYYNLGDDFVDLLRADAGTASFRLGRLYANYYVAAGAEVWIDLYVFLFDNRVATVIRFAAGET